MDTSHIWLENPTLLVTMKYNCVQCKAVYKAAQGGPVVCSYLDWHCILLVLYLTLTILIHYTEYRKALQSVLCIYQCLPPPLWTRAKVGMWTFKILGISYGKSPPSPSPILGNVNWLMLEQSDRKTWRSQFFKDKDWFNKFFFVQIPHYLGQG